ncbi:MAG TPA: Hsp20/alpha crystallin family protein [Dehalococcoidia bacterium]|nr:Hsp20/alpha crystallin family protein [Dehalococcoidia bacterium]
MTNLVRWDPFSELRTTMDRLFEEGFSRPWRLLGDQLPVEYSFPVEVSETDTAVDVKAALPGVRPDEVEVSIQNDVLNIRAEHKEQAEEQKRDYYRREIRYGSFHRAIALPNSVDADKAEARFENGILNLHLPKAEAARPKMIKVAAGNGVVSTQ